MSEQVTLLLVEDDDLDAMLVARAFKKERIGNPTVRAVNGIDALAKLRNHEVDSPYMVLLDLNMPQMGGLEFLAEIRKDPELKNTIVFVFTTSNEDRDRWAAYDHNIAGYLLKDGVGPDFLEAIKLLDCYWHIVEFP